MTFHGGFKEQILFNQWSTETVGGKYQISLFLIKKKQHLFFSLYKPLLDLGLSFFLLLYSMKV
jgi:hypothetical protein